MTDDAPRRRPITAAQWLAARALSECAPPTRRRIAAILGCDDSAVYARASVEGWRRIDFRRPEAQQAHADMMAVAASAGEQGGADAGTPPEGFDPDWADDENVVARQSAIGGERGAPPYDAAADTADDPVEMLQRGARFMSRRLGRLIGRAEQGGTLNKTEIDNLAALARMMERWETLAKERAKEEESNRDERIAEALLTVNESILRLAREEAERLVAAGFGPGDDDPAC